MSMTLKSNVVASFTDAWIETMSRQRICFCGKVASFTDAWIETKPKLPNYKKGKVASFTDAWIETSKDDEEEVLERRIFYRCVD